MTEQNTPLPNAASQPSNENDLPVSFGEIVRLIPELPGLMEAPESARAAVMENHALAPLGDWRGMALWLGQCQGSFPAKMDRPRLALYCAPHGHKKVDLEALLTPWHEGDAATPRLCRGQDLDLQVFEMATDNPTANFTQSPALSERAAAHAMAYGMMAAEPGLHLLALSSVGDEETGADKSALAVLHGVFRDFNSDDATVTEALAANRRFMTDPLTIMATLGGYATCACLGAIIAARLAKIPVVIEGLPALAAAMTLAQLAGNMNAGAHILGHVKLAAMPDGVPMELQVKIEKLIALAPQQGAQGGWRPGEGRASALALPLLRAVC